MFGAERTGGIVKLLGVIGDDVALVSREFSGLNRKADQAFTHPHEILYLGPHRPHCT